MLSTICRCEVAVYGREKTTNVTLHARVEALERDVRGSASQEESTLRHRIRELAQETLATEDPSLPPHKRKPAQAPPELPRDELAITSNVATPSLARSSVYRDLVTKERKEV